MEKHILKIKYKPYQIINQKSSNRILLICDHASNLIPKKYKRLGLNTKEIKSHIGWDVGAASLAKGIASRLNYKFNKENFYILIPCIISGLN